jgi:hypothetical protein
MEQVVKAMDSSVATFFLTLLGMPLKFFDLCG